MRQAAFQVDFTRFLHLLYDAQGSSSLGLSCMSAQVAILARYPDSLRDADQWKTLSDEELISAYREGWGPRNREEAADELFRRHQTRIARWCCRFTHDRESASDLAQEI